MRPAIVAAVLPALTLSWACSSGSIAPTGTSGHAAGSGGESTGSATGTGGSTETGGSTGTGGSPDPDAGTLLPACAVPSDLGDVTGKSMFLAVGQENVHLLSLDGKTWGNESQVPYGDGGGYNQVGYKAAYGAGTFVVAGPFGIETSTDGLLWSFASAPSIDPTTYDALAFLDGTFIALGSDAFYQAARGYTSTDGVMWKPVDNKGLAQAFGMDDFRHIYGLGSNGSRWVAVGFEGKVACSDDHGATWHDSTALGPGTKTNLRGVAWGNDQFVAVGDKGAVVRSSDGIVWSAWSLTPGLGDLTNVVFANGNFVACSLGACSSSPDGVSWKQSFTFDGPSGPIVHENGLFVGLRSPDSIYTSPDGAVWTKAFCQPSGQVGALTDIVFASRP